MLPVRFRPHALSLLDVVEGGYDVATGDYTEGGEEWSELIPCRYEPNGQARTVPVGEGKDYVYEYIVYLNRDCPDIRFGQECRLYDADGNTLEGDFKVKGFHRGQLNAKIWL